MGTEKDKSRALGRNKPPPIPPRPQHLVPTKTMAKYSSMPDVLNGWRRDPNPDLLKLNHQQQQLQQQHQQLYHHYHQSHIQSPPHFQHHPLHYQHQQQQQLLLLRASTLSPKLRALDVATTTAAAECYIRQNGTVFVGGAGGGVHAAKRMTAAAVAPPNDRVANENRAKRDPLAADVRSNGKLSKKFSCIPSRSNSKKSKKNAAIAASAAAAAADGDNGAYGVAAKNRSEISQTSWYVENVVDDTMTVQQLSKCEITLNGNGNGSGKTMIADNDCRYPGIVSVAESGRTTSTTVVNTPPTPPPPTTTSTAAKTNFFRKLRGSSHGNDVAKKASVVVPSSATPPMAVSTSSVSGLPPLPKSLSDASLLWDQSDKKLSSPYPVSLSPSSSSASSSSRTSAGCCPKVPSQSLSSSSASSSRSGSVVFDAAKSQHTSSASGGGGDAATQRDEKQRPTATPPPPPPRKPTSLDLKLATLRREMYDLRQMDLALLSQLWSLNEAIIEFRQMQVSLSPNSPSPHSSDEEDSGCYYSNVSSQGMVTSNQHSNTLGSNSSRSSVSTNRSAVRDATAGATAAVAKP